MSMSIESSIRTQNIEVDTGVSPDDEVYDRREIVARTVLVTAAGALFGAAIWKRSWLSIPLTLLGGLFVYRGLSGRPMAVPKFNADTPADGYKGIRVERSILINRPVSEVYQFWRMLENLPTFMHHLESVQMMEEGNSHWVARAPLGTHVEWDAQIVAERPNELIAWRSLPESPVHNMGVVRFRHAPGRQGTEVIVLLE